MNIFLLVICVFAIIGVASLIHNAYGEEYDYVWVPNLDEGYRKVPIIYTDHIATESNGKCGDSYAGCYQYDGYQTTEKIYFLKGWKAKPTSLGYNVWTHEVLHAWGVSHGEMKHWFNSGVPVDPLILAGFPDNYYPRMPMTGN